MLMMHWPDPAGPCRRAFVLRVFTRTARSGRSLTAFDQSVRRPIGRARSL